jgi:RNA polymerase sigma factor for flagellar operon FliA
VADAVRQIESRERRDARDHEVARELKLSLDEYHQILQDASGYLVMSFEDMGIDNEAVASELADRAPGPIDRVQNEAFKRSLSDAITSLPEREKLVMTLYYDEELNLREIGAVIGVSESRVSQIHSQALIRLQARLGRWLEAYSE